MRTLLVLLLIWSLACLPAQARPLFCRHEAFQSICVEDLKRSAKQYWEFRATVRREELQPVKVVVDCRGRRIYREQQWSNFQPGDGGATVCGGPWARASV